MPSPWRSLLRGQAWASSLGSLTGRRLAKSPNSLRKTEEGSAFGAFFFGDGGVAVGEADGAEEDAIGFFAELEGWRRGGLVAGGINTGPAERGAFRVILSWRENFSLDGAEDFEGFAHDFGADAVAGRQEAILKTDELIILWGEDRDGGGGREAGNFFDRMNRIYGMGGRGNGLTQRGIRREGAKGRRFFNHGWTRIWEGIETRKRTN